MLVAAPPAVVQIAQHAKQQEQGIVLYRLHRVFDVHAGPMHRHDVMELALISQDDRVVKVRVLHADEGGKPLDQTRIAQIEDQYERPKPADIFHRPFDPDYLSEYTYQALDSTTYRFTSTQHDGGHGNGTLWTDEGGNVVKYQYAPNVLPKYATSGTITYDRSQVLPGVWALTREAHEYRGHYVIFGGGATAVITYDSYVRYPDLPSAETALEKI